MRFAGSVMSYSPRVERALRAAAEHGVGPLHPLLRYHLGWVDQHGQEVPGAPTDRVHGALCLSSAVAFGADEEAGATAGASVELVYAFVEVHEDVGDGNPARHGRPAVWWVWGPAQAINLGDGLHVLGRMTLLGLRERGTAPDRVLVLLRTLDEAAQRVCAGEHQRLLYQERLDISTAQYLRLTRDVSGSLYGVALALGALLGGAPDASVQAMRRAGEAIGMAAGIRQDVEAVWSQETLERPDVPPETLGSMLNKTKLYPVVAALERGTARQKRLLGNVYLKRVLEPDDVASIRAVLEEVGTRGIAQAEVKRLADEAVAALREAGLRDSTEARALEDAARSVAGDSPAG